MFFALIAMNILHPGSVLVGAESEFKSRKERKRERQIEKERLRGNSENGVLA
jgi:hypothetical protein